MHVIVGVPLFSSLVSVPIKQQKTSAHAKASHRPDVTTGVPGTRVSARTGDAAYSHRREPLRRVTQSYPVAYR
uniref:Uncharacterized protein n=1 Tax=Human betaherpesvirus 6 TaxID=10368 RepID=A0A5P9T8C6_9BETA|nr:hypothetical protein [Human betaherpesvirus 6]QFV60986.1 hypothetical protein [Human betaherpesvirus 6]QFW10744.1 hypothetical protein [Human betaherpesvirus 6]QFW10756.1 hypothetical protein [Human betaherpesvirus 6]QFW25494.1 hypothetical protein [Human betaherpesvirus 6]